MANEKHLSRLREGVDSWNTWIEEQGVAFRADLRKANLGGADLRKANLEGADLSRADLRGVDLILTSLGRVTLNHADLRGANLFEADLRNASLVGANLIGATLNGVKLGDADLSRAYFIRASISQANLNRAILNGADLTGADINRASLRGAMFNDANLSRADLSGADLYGAGLSGANLSYTDLIGADLNCADLRAANLNRANFSSADLNYAHINGAYVQETVFGDANLSNLDGLGTIVHRGPSVVDLRTIQKTSPPLPEVFLRGCGFSDLFVDYLPTFLNQPIQFYSCFISYSHTDKAFARRLHDQLQGKGIRCWLDEHQMLPGDDIYEQVDRGIKLWDKTLLCCSEYSLTSWWVDGEINTAFAKERHLMKERKEKILSLIPLNLDNYLFEGGWKSKGKEEEVKRRLAADFTGWETDNTKFEEAFEKLIRALQADDAGREQPPPSLL